MTSQSSQFQIGQVGFGRVNNYGPTKWKFQGVRNGSCVLEHVRHPSQSVAYPDQFVSWDVVSHIMKAG